MNKADILANFENVDHNTLSGNKRIKDITKLYLEGMSVKNIAQN